MNKYTLYANRRRLAMTAATATVHTGATVLLIGVLGLPWYLNLGPVATATWVLYQIWGDLLFKSGEK